MTLGLFGFVDQRRPADPHRVASRSSSSFDFTVGDYPPTFSSDTLVAAIVGAVVLSLVSTVVAARRPATDRRRRPSTPAGRRRSLRGGRSPVRHAGLRHRPRRAGRGGGGRRARSPIRGSASTRVKANDVAGGHGRGGLARVRRERRFARRVGDRPPGGRPDDRITLEGVGKTDADLRAAVRATRRRRRCWVAIESADEAEVADRDGPPGRSRAARRPPLDVLLRLNPDVAPETDRRSPSAAARPSSA